MIPPRSTLTVVMAAVSGLWILGCYTTLKHPVLRAKVEGEEEWVRVSHGDDCWTCHSARSERFWTDETPPPAIGYYAWDYYFSSPWWLEQPYVVQVPAPEEELSTPRGVRRGNQSLTTPGAPAVQQSSPTLQGVARRIPAAAEPAATEVKPAEDQRRDAGRRESTQSDTTKSNRRTRRP